MMTLHCNSARPVHKSLCATLVYTACLCGEISLFFKALTVHMTSLNIILFVPFSNLKRSVKVSCLPSQVDKFTTSILEIAQDTVVEIEICGFSFDII